jgi:hypothetical protein
VVYEPRSVALRISAPKTERSQQLLDCPDQVIRVHRHNDASNWPPEVAVCFPHRSLGRSVSARSFRSQEKGLHAMEGTTDPRVQELKRQIARGRYHVDGSEIADAILRKLALVERGRRATATSEPAFDPATSRRLVEAEADDASS